jgi:ribokinase
VAGDSILVVGSMNADLVVRTHHLPGPGETVAGGPLSVSPGGKSSNQAAAAALLGADVKLVGAVGDDPHGELLISEAASRGVDVASVRKTPKTSTGTAVITVDRGGENTIVVSPGANGTLTADDVPSALIEASALVCLALEVPLPVVRAVAQHAKQAGVPVLLNPSPVVSRTADLLACADIVVLNEHEMAMLSGASVHMTPEWLVSPAAAEPLRSLGVPAVVVTLGGAGAVVWESGGLATAVPPTATTVVDTTGAGDAFTGALAAELAAGSKLLPAARLAARVGAYSTTKDGAQPSYPTRDQLAAFE